MMNLRGLVVGCLVALLASGVLGAGNGVGAGNGAGVGQGQVVSGKAKRRAERAALCAAADAAVSAKLGKLSEDEGRRLLEYRAKAGGDAVPHWLTSETARLRPIKEWAFETLRTTTSLEGLVEAVEAAGQVQGRLWKPFPRMRHLEQLVAGAPGCRAEFDDLIRLRQTDGLRRGTALNDLIRQRIVEIEPDEAWLYEDGNRQAFWNVFWGRVAADLPVSDDMMTSATGFERFEAQYAEVMTLYHRGEYAACAKLAEAVYRTPGVEAAYEPGRDGYLFCQVFVMRCRWRLGDVAAAQAAARVVLGWGESAYVGEALRVLQGERD